MNNIEFEELAKTCVDEEIQFLGDIQDFSCLLAIDLKDSSVVVASQNMKEALGLDVSEILNSDLESMFSLNSIEKMKKIMSSGESFKDVPLELEVLSKSVNFYSHRAGKHLVLEKELKNSDIDLSNSGHFISSVASFELSEQITVENLSQTFSDTLKEITKYDRVMVYKFHEDGHGEVISESKNESLDSYLGLHYPASDIPVQARALYKKNTARVIEGVDYERVKLVSKKVSPKSFDLTHSLSRHVSPVHIQYLKNMKVISTLSLSLIVDGKLWGLVVFHNYSVKYASFSDRAFLKLISLSFSSKISEVLQHQKSLRISKSNILILSMVDHLSSKDRILNSNLLESICSEYSKQLLELLDSSGVYIQMGDQSAKYGAYPGGKTMEGIKNSLKTHPEQKVYTCRSFRNDDNIEAETTSACAGGLAIGFSHESTSFFVTWFRPEFQEELSWAGEKTGETQEIDGRITLRPRSSFEEVKKTNKNMCRNFTELDHRVAQEFMWFFSKVLAEQLVNTDKKLVKSREESEMKNRFLSNLSHELRTPLNNILGWLQINEEKLSNDEDLLNFSKVVKNNSEQQLSLVNDLLETTRIQTGKIELKLETLNLNELTRDLLHYFKPSFFNKKISVKIIDESLDLLSRVDKGRFEQVLRNVIQNAIKFTPKGGAINVTLKKHHSDIQISIKDSGIGISRGSIGRVFDGFYQVDAEDAKKHNRFGLGLGLSLAKSLIELHGGSISIFSEGENKGTEVLLSVPTAILEMHSSKKTSTDFNKKPKVSKSIKDLEILLVEDTEESARFVKIFLEREGANVVWANNASDALNFLARAKFDLVISDIGLPVMDGLSFVREASKYLDIDETPFIALSAYGGVDEIAKSIEAGFKKHLLKPIKFTELITHVKEVCDV